MIKVIGERDGSSRALNDSNTWRRSLKPTNESSRASTTNLGGL